MRSPPPRHAVLDVGTNSAKLLIGKLDEGALQVELERAVVTRLGEGLHESGRLSDEAMRRTHQTIAGFVTTARERDVRSIVAVGTLGLRRAANATEFLAAVKASTGVDVEVITGAEEARLSYLAATSVSPAAGRLCVFDIGGGSIELVYGVGRTLESRRSVELGVRITTDRFLRSNPPRGEEVEALRAWLETELGELDGDVDEVVGVGGTVTTLAAVALDVDLYDGSRSPGYRLSLEEVERQIQLYGGCTLVERQSIHGLVPERADVILAGACVVATLMRKLRKPAITVSHRGLRHGVWLDRFGGGVS